MSPDSDQRLVCTLTGERIALTGRLASMTQAEAAALIERLGGACTSRVSRRSTMLVVGAEGWPLKADGRLTQDLLRARSFAREGAAIEIVREQDFLDRAAADSDQTGGVHSRYTLLQLAQSTGLSRDRLRSWQECGLVQPVENCNGIDYFDYADVSRARTLVHLLQSGVAAQTLRRSLQQLECWLPDVGDWLHRLDWRGRRFVLRRDDGAIVEPDGQMLLGFDDHRDAADDDSGVIRLPSDDADEPDLFRKGLELEETGRLGEAVAVYRRLLARDGPDADVCFNLGNAVYAQQDPLEAVGLFQQAVQFDPTFLEAWNNLGNVLIELGRPAEAVVAFRRALDVDPAYPDAHYSLAEALEAIGERDAARVHWRAYLDLDDDSPWADHARTRLHL